MNDETGNSTSDGNLRALGKVLPAALAVTFYGLLLLPALATIFGLPSVLQQNLGGVEVSSTLPEWLPEDLASGQFQRQFEQWFSASNKLRGVLIRNDNQLNYSLFGCNKKATPIGKKRFLFQEAYLEDFNGLHNTSDATLQSFAARLRRLQSLLSQRGVKFLFFLTPSKVALYPEYVPARLLVNSEGSKVYERFIAMLRDKEIPVLDGVSLARAQKISSPFPVFAPGGAHWTSYTSCKAAEVFTEMMPSLIGRETPRLFCDPAVVHEHPLEVDMDLAKLINIWTPSVFETSLPYPTLRVEKSAQAHLAKVLFVGDSFLTLFLGYLETDPVYASRDLYYYFHTAEHFRIEIAERPQNPIDPKTLDWNFVFTRELIVLEINESQIFEGGYGFVDAALDALENPAPPQR